MSETPFKAGDWIIATGFIEGTAENIRGVAVAVTDKSYTKEPILILEICEAHLVYASNDFKDKKHIMILTELEERGFIIANNALVEVVKQKVLV